MIAPARHAVADPHPPNASPSLATQLRQVARCVQAVEQGHSLNEVLPQVPAGLRPGVQALTCHALRQLGTSRALLAELVQRKPDPAVQALMCAALALLLPQAPGETPGQAPRYTAHTVVNQTVDAAKADRGLQRQSAFINACLRRFLRESAALLTRVAEQPQARWNHPIWWIERLQRDHPLQWQAILEANNRPGSMDLRVNRRHASPQAYAQALLAVGDGRPVLMPQVRALERAIDERLPFAAAQAQVSIGQPGIARNDPDFFPLFVGNYILGGGGFVSRLTTEVREKRGLTYSVFSYFAPGRHAGAFQIGLTTRPDQAALAVEVSRNVVKQFVEQGPSEAELVAAKAFLVNGFSLRIDSNRKLLDNVANIGWNGLPLDYLDTWTQQIERVSVADIRRSFARVLQPDRMVTVVVGAQP